MSKLMVIGFTATASVVAGCTFTSALAPAGGSAVSNQPVMTTGGSASKSPTGVRVTTDALVLPVGNTKELSGSVNYVDGTFDGNLNWSSSDDTIVAVNPTSGKVSAIKAGLATIVATSVIDPSKRTNVLITVRAATVEDAITSITPSEVDLKVSDTTRLEAKIQMTDGSLSPNVTWDSDNKAVAMVSNGLVTAVGPGETMVTATAAGDSTKKASAKVIVRAK